MIELDIGETVDQLVTIELRPRLFNDDLTMHLYHAARRVIGAPICLTAAKKLLTAVKEDDVVIIGTGHWIPNFLPHGETDGPPSAAALARIITRGIGARVVLIGDEPVISVLKAACMANGVSTMANEEAKDVPRSVTLIPFPVDENEANRTADEMIDIYKPAAIITVEKIGRNRLGVYHTGKGSDMSSFTAKVDTLMLRGRERGILTIGIGDLGNESGLGNIRDSVEKFFPYGAKCMCPCRGGAATVVESDVPIVAAVSNWGAYGIETCLAYLLGDPQLLHDEESEQRMIQWTILAGAVDGVSASPVTHVDGIPMRIHKCLICMLHAIIEVKSKRVVSYRP